MEKYKFLDLCGLRILKNFISNNFCTKDELKKIIGTGNDNIFYNEIIAETEPTEQKIGDYWMKEY